MYCDDELADDLMSQITVYPSLKSENFSQGLCGGWSKKKSEMTAKSKLEKESDEQISNYIIKNRFLFTLTVFKKNKGQNKIYLKT